ncbi:MAG: hypothetical protein KA149_06210 [Chitinophagales bacterium]|nr:hypothetical protein [Chitinophagales bacterium]
MSHAFVKEDDPQWLHEVAPTLKALAHYLSTEHNGRPMYEKRNWFDAERKLEFHEMTDGLTYFINEAGTWDVFLD